MADEVEKTAAEQRAEKGYRTIESTVTSSKTALDDAQRVNEINNMYDANRQNAQDQLKTAYDQNMSDLEAARDKINPQYQAAKNDASAQYERVRRNNNLQAQANGLNTGAGSQMQLAEGNQYLANQSALDRAQADAMKENERTQLDLTTTYRNKIAEAASNNDYQRSAALLDEYSEQYTRSMEKAKSLAEFGNFDGYAELYGAEQAKQMQQAWAAQDPDIAYKSGVISGEEYFALTGTYPAGYGAAAAGGGGGGRYGSMLTSGVLKDANNNYAGVGMVGGAVLATGGPAKTVRYVAATGSRWKG